MLAIPTYFDLICDDILLCFFTSIVSFMFNLLPLIYSFIRSVDFVSPPSILRPEEKPSPADPSFPLYTDNEHFNSSIHYQLILCVPGSMVYLVIARCLATRHEISGTVPHPLPFVSAAPSSLTCRSTTSRK